MPNLEFVNHSSIILSHKGISLGMDPWIEGSVFNKSWDLLVSTPSKSIENLSTCDYIWFSHEHPDHFNPPNLKIFSDKNTFLFQKTLDGRVVNYLSKISKNVRELAFDCKLKIGEDFKVQIIPFQYLDSMLVIELNNKKILNLNDCDIKNDKQLEIIKKFTGDIDILLVQFSYAIGKSNKNNNKEREIWAQNILNRLNHKIKYLKPKTVIPFASFCFFSQFDNFYLNDSINKIGPTIDFLKKNNPNTEFLCFYPGDKWRIGDNWDNANSILKYEKIYNSIKPNNKIIDIIDDSTLISSSKKFINKTLANNNLFKIFNFLNSKYYRIFFKTTDSDKTFYFDFNNGLTLRNLKNDSEPFCELTSSSLNQLFNSGYGYDALIIGGRFEANNLGIKCLDKIFKFQAKNYENIYYNFNNLIPKFLNRFAKYSKIFQKR